MYPPVAFPPPPPTSNTLSNHERSALVRSSRKLYQVLGDVPRVPDDDTSRPSTSESTWHKRKPSHLPPLLKFHSGTVDIPDSPESKSPAYHRPPSQRGSVLSLSPSIVSNAPSTASADTTQRRTKLERLRRKLGNDVPTTAVFPPTPTTSAATAAPPKKTSRTSTRPVVPSTDDAHSIAFSINSDESVHRVTFTTRVQPGSPHPHKTKHVYHTGPLPPVPSHVSRDGDGGDVGLLRPRQKMAAGSMIGGADFKAARRAKREGRNQNSIAEPWELVEIVGYMH